MDYFYGSTYIKDGTLDANCGRIVIYKDQMIYANNRSADHNYLLRALASRMLEDKNKVINNAIRLYFKREPGRIIISSVRKIDDEAFEANIDYYAKMIKANLKWKWL